MSKRSSLKTAAPRKSVRRAVATRPGSARRRLTIWSRRKLIAAICLAMTLALVGGSFASFRVSRSNKAKQAERAQSLQPQDASNPSKEYIYLGAGGRLIATEESAAQTPSAPQNLVVTGVSSSGGSGTVSLHWNAPASGQVDHYIVQRAPTVGTAYSPASGNLPNTTFAFTDSGVLGFHTYLYQVVAYSSPSGGASPPSNTVYATAVTFVDDPVVQFVTVVSGNHIAQLRQGVQAMWTAAALGTPTWSDAANHGDRVNAVDITDLRNKLDAALGAFGLATKPYTYSINSYQQTGIASKIHATDVSEIRLRIEWYQ
jgi:hypothetical protein